MNEVSEGHPMRKHGIKITTMTVPRVCFRFLSRVLARLHVWSAILWLVALGGSAFAQQPNIILILADDMGPGEVSHAGGLIPTPVLDRMAMEGMRFTDAHTSSAVCTPTRYGILTGRYNWRSRLKKSVLFSATSEALMDPNRLSLPRFLKEQGYYTGMIGKWHLGVNWKLLDESDPRYKPKHFGSWEIDYSQPFTHGPLENGFDEAFFINGSLDMPPYLYLDGNKATEVPTGNRGFQHNEHNDFQRIGAAAADFDPSTCLREWATRADKFITSRADAPKDQPFFLYLPLTSPHTPVVPGKAFKGRYPQYNHYADFIAETDWVVQQVLNALDESGTAENTLLIYSSDNGFAAYVPLPKMMAAGYTPSGPSRGFKTSIYEGGHRVPFLVRWPKVVPANSKSDVTICTTDFFATFAEILGNNKLPDDAAEDSFSFLPCLKGKQQSTRPFTIHHSGGGTFAIRKGDWKLVLTNKSAGGGYIPKRSIKHSADVVQLFNMKNDVEETKNLEQSHPEK